MIFERSLTASCKRRCWSGDEPTVCNVY